MPLTQEQQNICNYVTQEDHASNSLTLVNAIAGS